MILTKEEFVLQKLYDKKDFDWLYYYVFVILFIDFDSSIDRELYEKICCYGSLGVDVKIKSINQNQDKYHKLLCH